MITGSNTNDREIIATRRECPPCSCTAVTERSARTCPLCASRHLNRFCRAALQASAECQEGFTRLRRLWLKEEEPSAIESFILYSLGTVIAVLLLRGPYSVAQKQKQDGILCTDETRLGCRRFAADPLRTLERDDRLLVVWSLVRDDRSLPHDPLALAFVVLGHYLGPHRQAKRKTQSTRQK